MTAIADRKFYIDALASEECHCGRWKKSKMSLCYKCYSSLPDDLKKGLWRRIEDGYGEAYDDAVGWLI